MLCNKGTALAGPQTLEKMLGFSPCSIFASVFLFDKVPETEWKFFRRSCESCFHRVLRDISLMPFKALAFITCTSVNPRCQTSPL